MKTKDNPAFALEDTLAVYGIRNNPFPVDETDDFFFSTPILAKQIDVLRNLVEYGDLLLIVSGVEGAGKSTFLKQFLLTADKSWKCCRIDAREGMTIDSLVDELPRSTGMCESGHPWRSDAKAAGAPAGKQAAHDLDWLRRQDPSHYVIQVVGARDASAVSKFLDQHDLGFKGAWFVTTHENKPWYVVDYGMYPDNRSARAAIETLPERLRAGSPWPRSVASIIESAR